MSTKKKKQILLIGDISMDWHVTKLPRDQMSNSYWPQMKGNISSSMGGVMLLHKLLENCIDCNVSFQNNTPLSNGQYSEKTIMLCSPFLKKKESKSDKVIRIENLSGFNSGLESQLVEFEDLSTISPQIVVIDDSGLGIRNQYDEIIEILTKLPKIESGEDPLIILKVAWPIIDNPLLNALVKQYKHRLIVICPIDDLRRDKLQISRGLSWEQTAQDISWEFNYNPRMKIFSEIHSLIIPIGLAGVWFSMGNHIIESKVTDPKSTLLFDQRGIEGDMEKQQPGLLLGYTSCFTLGILKSLVNLDSSDLLQLSYYGLDRSFIEKNPLITILLKASCCGLSAMQSLHLNGYQIDKNTLEINLPFEKIKESIENPTKFPAVSVPIGHRHYSVPIGRSFNFKGLPEWTILKDISDNSSKMLELAIKIVKKGTDESLNDVPYAKFGGLTTVDRNEIEAFRTTNDLIFDYCNNPSIHRPLSIAVFGPPGSGKSFGISQVAKSVAGENIEKITFNVSQFSTKKDFIDALHRVRDIGLTGKIPLVFWDEFDSSLSGEKLAWLKIFLAPMQDGEFTQGEITHPIGRAIFVFAGSTVSNLNDFEIKFEDDELRAAKVPDFKSRLRGCINMVGIDRIKKEQFGIIDSDSQYIIRRAIILRSIIERARPDIIGKNKNANIDIGLLKALLLVWSYRHGVRSLESIIELCHLGDSGILHRSSLPPQNVIDMHVDSDQFLGLITSDVEFSGGNLETLAAAFHEMYREKSPDSPLSKLSYDKLSKEDQEKNMAAVKGIPYKLASIHFIYQEDTENVSTESDDLNDEEIDLLAKIEHDRWIIDKINDGYVYGDVRNNEIFPKTHPDLVPWDSIQNEQILKIYPEIVALKLGPGPLKNSVDRELAKEIPEIMRRAGYNVKRINSFA